MHRLLPRRSLIRTLLASVALLAAACSPPSLSVTSKPGVTQPHAATPPDEVAILVTTPPPGQSIHSPLTVSGRARGPWYFEASFPITLRDANGAVLAQTHAQAQGEWMTTQFVPFTATVVFNPPTTKTGELVLENDNPSGEPANAQVHRIPVRFASAIATRSESGVYGVVTMGPTCPVERMPPDPNCADRPQVATFSIDTPTGAHIATFTSAADGSFSTRLPAGTYVISLQMKAAMPSMAPETFTVTARTQTQLSLRLDSGIR